MRLSILILAMFSLHSAFGQSRAAKLEAMKENAIELTNIEPALYRDGELDFLKKSIGEKRIVFLGENGHFDGSTLRAKSKVIKYLHDEMDFDVLLLEKGLFETDRAWRDLVEKRDTPLMVFASLMDLYGMSVSLHEKDLYEYIGEQAFTENPLVIGGVDITESSTSYAWGIRPDLHAALNMVFGSLWPKDVERYYSIFKRNYNIEHVPVGYAAKKAGSRQFFIKTFQECLEKNNEISVQDRRFIAFMVQALKSEGNWQYWAENKPRRSKKKGYVKADYFTLRDKFMAENLIWHIEKFYPNKKIIVSTSTYHISRNVEKIKPRPYMLGKDAVPMGQYVWDLHAKDIYSIAFISHHGYEGSLVKMGKVIKLKKRKKDGVEDLMHRAGLPYGFLDLVHLPAEMAYMKDIHMNPTFIDSYKTDWSQIYDGVFYIDEMKPDESFGYPHWLNRPTPYSPSSEAP